MTSKIKFMAAMTGLFMVLTGAAEAKNENSIQVKGSDTMVNLVQSWAEEFMKTHPDSFIAVTGGGSGTGIASIINGTCDLAASSREIKGPERELAGKKGVDPKEYKVALDGLAVVVNPENPISTLTMDQLSDVFTGKVKNWKEIGGPDAKIVVLSREVNSGTHVYFKEHVLRKGNAKGSEEFAPDALLLPSSQAIADEVASNKAAIGYYGMGYISKAQKAVAVAKDASGKGVLPTVDAVVSGDYPISRPLYLYSNGLAKDQVRTFLEYILSNEGQAIVSQQDFVPLK